MTFSKIGRLVTALIATAALGLGMTGCGGGTIGYMWVLGTFYNQISGYLIDDYTGNLTPVQHSPFSSGGSNPTAIVLKPGGRYVYVVNSGAGMVGTPGSVGYVAPTGAAITEFSVGSGGLLTFEQNFSSQGVDPVWAAIDQSGNYLYVLDKYAPDFATTKNGSISAFSIAGDTGRLTPLPNTTILSHGLPQTWFEVGPNPIMSKIGGTGCLYTLSPNSIYPYSINTGNGQLTVPTTGSYQVTGSNSLSSINISGSSSYIYLTDFGGNSIYSLQPGGSVSCSLTQISSSIQANLSGTAHPVNSLTTTSGKYLYVINQTSTSSIAPSNSSISGFNINGQGQLQAIPDGTNNPYGVGSGPVCIVQDPTNQYLYTSNGGDNTITGKQLNQSYGYLADLRRGSVFPVTKNPTCMVVSPNI